MLDLPANLIAEKNKLETTAPWLLLLEITLTDTPSAGATVLRICNNNEDVTFKGHVYPAFSFQMGIVESGVEGAIPVVSLRVSNVTKFLQPYLNDFDGGLGSTVKITLVNTDHLTENYDELEMYFTVMACTAGPLWVEWTLGMANPLNSRFPQYRYLAKHCPWQFADGVECGYAGVLTTCDHTLPDCVERDNTANFGGWLGMKSGGLQLA